MRTSELVFPRPVALITTGDEEEDNVATYSFLMPVSFKPKQVSFAVAPSRYTYQLLKKNREFVLHLVEKNLLEEVLFCGRNSGREVDKFEETRLEKVKSKLVKPPTIKQCPVALEAEVKSVNKSGDHYLVIGEVVHHEVNKEDFKPLLHITGNRFAVGEEFQA